MESCDWMPFVKAAVERSPISLGMMESKSVDEVYTWLQGLSNTSIYEGRRLAQPDEVANYNCGDGLEKAFLLANIIRQKNPEQVLELIVDHENVLLKTGQQYRFESTKGLMKRVLIKAGGDIIVAEI
jgi:hypothetical protein